LELGLVLELWLELVIAVYSVFVSY